MWFIGPINTENLKVVFSITSVCWRIRRTHPNMTSKLPKLLMVWNIRHSVLCHIERDVPKCKSKLWRPFAADVRYEQSKSLDYRPDCKEWQRHEGNEETDSCAYQAPSKTQQPRDSRRPMSIITYTLKPWNHLSHLESANHASSSFDSSFDLNGT